MNFKTGVFGALAALAVVAGVMAVRTDPAFHNSLWSQVFWLISSTLATTFILQALLDRDARRRKRQELQFGFRSFAAFATRLVLRCVGLEDATVIASLQRSAIAGNAPFREALERTAALIRDVDRTRMRSNYDEFYLKTSIHLADVGRDYIRVFSSSPEDMLHLYENLQHLANEWRYKAELTDIYEQHTRETQDPADRQARIAARTTAEDEVIDLSNRTFEMLVDLARRVEKGAGFYKD